MQSSTTCSACHGTGSVIEGACEECEGQGRVPDRQRVSVEIPAGIRDGQQLKVSGFGEAGMQGASAGDLIVTVRVKPHENFERDGNTARRHNGAHGAGGAGASSRWTASWRTRPSR